MSVFDKYAQYYDLLYKDKNYLGEVEYIESQINKYRSGASTILDLGCGSGKHAVYFAEHGFSVYGVDQSEQMIYAANQNKSYLTAEISNRLMFRPSDIKAVALNRTFDVVTSLFHVVSYQIYNSDLQNMFSVAANHLETGGIFIFDCWYGPAVLTDPPQVRVKRVQNEKLDVLRIAEPTMHSDKNVVELIFSICVTDRQSKSVEHITEVHEMRYLFKPEIELLLSLTDLRLIDAQQWMTGKSLDFNSWYGCFIAQKT